MLGPIIVIVIGACLVYVCVTWLHATRKRMERRRSRVHWYP